MPTTDMLHKLGHYWKRSIIYKREQLAYTDTSKTKPFTTERVGVRFRCVLGKTLSWPFSPANHRVSDLTHIPNSIWVSILDLLVAFIWFSVRPTSTHDTYIAVHKYI